MFKIIQVEQDNKSEIIVCSVQYTILFYHFNQFFIRRHVVYPCYRVLSAVVFLGMGSVVDHIPSENIFNDYFTTFVLFCCSGTSYSESKTHTIDGVVCE
jgi:hypothetical protein